MFWPIFLTLQAMFWMGYVAGYFAARKVWRKQ
jgi:uncharacterized protein YneF (UPF0154 family)